MRKIIVCLILLTLVAAPSLAEIKPSANKYHRKLADATFALYGQSGDRHHMLCTATAFLKTPTGYKLLTASHCVKDSDLPDDLKFSVAEYATDNINATMPVTVDQSVRNDAVDFAILDFKTTKIYPVIPLGNENELRIESKVYNVNFSQAITKQTSLGRVASTVMPNHGAEGKCTGCPNRYMVHLFDGGGASGSAIVSEKTHQIVGILVGGFDETLGAEIEPISSIIAEMKKSSPKP